MPGGRRVLSHCGAALPPPGEGGRAAAAPFLPAPAGHHLVGPLAGGKAGGGWWRRLLPGEGRPAAVPILGATRRPGRPSGSLGVGMALRWCACPVGGGAVTLRLGLPPPGKGRPGSGPASPAPPAGQVVRPARWGWGWRFACANAWWVAVLSRCGRDFRRRAKGVQAAAGVLGATHSPPLHPLAGGSVGRAVGLGADGLTRGRVGGPEDGGPLEALARRGL
jgi:hypothetical protein